MLEQAVRRAIELSATKYCPVNAMLSAGATEIHHRYRMHCTGLEREAGRGRWSSSRARTAGPTSSSSGMRLRRGPSASGQRHPVGDREHADRDPLVGREALVQPPHAERVLVLHRVVDHAAVPEDVVVGREPAGPEQPDDPLVVVGILRLAGVDEREVERALGAAGEQLRRASRGPARAGGRPDRRRRPRPSTGARPPSTPRRRRSRPSSRRAASPARRRASCSR